MCGGEGGSGSWDGIGVDLPEKAFNSDGRIKVLRSALTAYNDRTRGGKILLQKYRRVC